MGLFSKKKKTEEKAPATETQVKSSVPEKAEVPSLVVRRGSRSSGVNTLILSRPHITEKASDLSGYGTYAFVVRGDATKQEIAKAIARVYKVTPIKVRIVVRKGKRVMKRHGMGTRGGMKKAYVTLRKGETIEFV